MLHHYEIWLTLSIAFGFLGGCVTLTLTRLLQGGMIGVWCQAAFYLVLIAVAGMTTFAVATASPIWLLGGFTVALMSIGGIVDFEGSAKPAYQSHS